MNMHNLTDEELLRHAYTLDPLVQSELERELMTRMTAMLDEGSDEVKDLTRDVENLESGTKRLEERIRELEKENDDQAEEILRLERELDAVGTT